MNTIGFLRKWRTHSVDINTYVRILHTVLCNGISNNHHVFYQLRLDNLNIALKSNLRLCLTGICQMLSRDVVFIQIYVISDSLRSIFHCTFHTSTNGAEAQFSRYFTVTPSIYTFVYVSI